MAKATIQSLGFLVALGVVLFGSAGRTEWPAGWWVMFFIALWSVVGLLLLPSDLIEERSRIPADSKGSDLLIGGTAFALLLPVTLAVCGFDFRRHWSPSLPRAIELAAFAVFAIGYVISLWAARENRYFSAVVRIQRERGHRLVTTGPYAFVRHPGYAGPIAAHLALPLALGSLWGLVPAVLGSAFLVLRIGYEERTLASEFPEHREYVQRVPWRLLPGVW